MLTELVRRIWGSDTPHIELGARAGETLYSQIIPQGRIQIILAADPIERAALVQTGWPTCTCIGCAGEYKLAVSDSLCIDCCSYAYMRKCRCLASRRIRATAAVTDILREDKQDWHVMFDDAALRIELRVSEGCFTRCQSALLSTQALNAEALECALQHFDLSPATRERLRNELIREGFIPCDKGGSDD